MKPIKQSNGYLTVSLSGKIVGVHRLVADAFIPNPENKPQVNHKNADKTDNNADNLEWCTASENSRHAVAMGLCNFRTEKHIEAARQNIKRAQEVNMKRFLAGGAS